MNKIDEIKSEISKAQERLNVAVDDKKYIKYLNNWNIVDEDLSFNWISSKKPINIQIDYSNYDFYYKVVSKK